MRPAFPKVESPIKFGIGDHIHMVFTQRIGAGTPCGECSKRISDINKLSPDEVRLKLDDIVKDIASRASTNAPKWWQKIAVKADQAFGLGQTDDFIRECVLEAIRRYEAQ